jgi:hypothetical protein
MRKSWQVSPRSILGHRPPYPLVEKPHTQADASTSPRHGIQVGPLRGRLLSREGPGHLCPWRKQGIYALNGTRAFVSLEGAGAFMPLMRSGSRVGLQARALLRPGRAGPCLTQPSENLLQSARSESTRKNERPGMCFSNRSPPRPFEEAIHVFSVVLISTLPQKGIILCKPNLCKTCSVPK